MAKNFIASLQLKTLEQQQVAFMLATGFFMGVFIATYQVTADSLFLNRLGEYLDKAFLITGILGILFTGLFSFFQSFIRFSILTILVVTGVLSFVIIVYYLLHFGSQEIQNPLVFAMFCASGPIIALLFLCYWGTFGRLFNFRQSKSIIGWIDTGQLVAAILASFLIPLSGRLVPDTTDYLFVCAGAILMMGILLSIIAAKFSLAKNNPNEIDRAVRKESSLGRMFADPYILMMSLLLAVSMTAFVFNQFSFQEMIRIQYPNQRELTDFNAFFTGTVFAFSLMMQTFVNNKIIGNYGLRISLFILPIALGVLSLGSVIAGSVFGYDKVTSPAGFVYFFLFVAMSRLFNWTLRESLENPVFKLFFIPLDSRIRFNVQAKVEGLVNESSRFIAGLLIFVLAFIPAFEVIHISIALIVLSGCYFLVVNKLYSGYRNKIRQKLESTDIQQDKLEKGFVQFVSKLKQLISFPAPGKAVFSYKLLEKLDAEQTPTWVNSLIRNDDESVRYYAQGRMNEIKGLSVSDQYVIRLDSSKVNSSEKNVLTESDLKILIDNAGEITKSRIQRLCRSTNSTDRHYGAELLLHAESEECTPFLVELLNDHDTKVRSTAIKSAVKKNNPEVINALIENLASPIFGNYAMDALELIGQKALPAFEASFYKSGQHTHLMLRILQTMGRIGGQRARELLWNKIDYPNKLVVSQVLLALGECGFKANISQVTRIKFGIESDLADIRWNLSAIQEISELPDNQQIIKALRNEIKNDIEHIYMLLAMLYDTHSIQLVKESIDSGTPEGITYAVELLDVFLSEQLKQRVIPVLDDISDTERINRLDLFYPRIKFDEKLVLKFIINRDFTQSNRWTKSCVLFYIGKYKMDEFKLDLIAHMFNPDVLIQEVASWSLNEIDSDEYEKNSIRLGKEVKRNLDAVILQPRLSDFGKVLFFSGLSLFNGIPGLTLSYLADITEQVNLGEGKSLLLDEKVNNSFYIVSKGEVDYFQRGFLFASYSQGQFIGEHVALPNFINTNLVVAKTDASLLRINKDQFYELLSDNVELADRVIDYV